MTARRIGGLKPAPQVLEQRLERQNVGRLLAMTVRRIGGLDGVLVVDPAGIEPASESPLQAALHT